MIDSYLYKLFNLQNKNIIIIGAGGHICSKLAEGFYKCGSNLALIDIRYNKIKLVKENINSQNNQMIELFQMDASIKKDHEVTLKKIKKKFKSIDVIINGAGINDATPFFDISYKNWLNVIDSQLTATFFGCQVFGKEMLNKKKGSIINISSASSGPPLSKAFAYSVSKASIKNLTYNLAREWAKSNVRVNALRPGFFPTKWNIKNFIDNKRKKQILNHTPMNRFGETSELIGGALYLASDASKFVTGTELTIDGGFSCMTI